MYKIFKLSVFISLAFVGFTSSASAQMTIAGEVVDVIDGRTVLVAIPSGRVKVELQYIDVPDPGQKLCETVKEHLRQLTLGKSVEYRPKTLQKDRAVGQLTIKGVDVSQQMLRDGAAWHTPLEASGQGKAEYDVYASMEANARIEKLGVWSIPGLRPSWEVRAENESKAKAWQYTSKISGTGNKNTRAGANPSLGNVGALVNGFDPETGNGYLGTSFLPVYELDRAMALEYETTVDISYFYKQDAQNRRKGYFVISVVTVGKRFRFPTNNTLVMVGDGRNIVIGKPKRTASKSGGTPREKLVYTVARSTMDTIVNNDDVLLKLGGYLMEPSPGLKYLLYNLMQVSK